MTNMLDHSPRKTGGGDREKNRNFSQKILKRGDEQCQNKVIAIIIIPIISA